MFVGMIAYYILHLVNYIYYVIKGDMKLILIKSNDSDLYLSWIKIINIDVVWICKQ